MPPISASHKVHLRDGWQAAVEGSTKKFFYYHGPTATLQWNCPENTLLEPPWRRILNVNNKEIFTAKYQGETPWSSHPTWMSPSQRQHHQPL